MKKLIYPIAIFALLWFVFTKAGFIGSTLITLAVIAIVLWNKRIVILTNLASQAYFVKGDKEKAYERYQKAYKSGFMNANCKISFAAFCLYTKKYEKSSRLLNEVINSSRSTPADRFNARHYLAILTWKTGSLDEAISLMTEVHNEAPSTGTYGTLGAFYIEKAKADNCFEEHIDFLLEAYDFNDSDKTIIDNLGEYYLHTGDYEKARKLYIKLFETEQISPVPYFHYAQVLKALGDTENAKANLEKALTCRFTRALTVSREMIQEELDSLN